MVCLDGIGLPLEGVWGTKWRFIFQFEYLQESHCDALFFHISKWDPALRHNIAPVSLALPGPWTTVSAGPVF